MLNSLLQEDEHSPVSSLFTSGHYPPVSGMDVSFSLSLSQNWSCKLMYAVVHFCWHQYAITNGWDESARWWSVLCWWYDTTALIENNEWWCTHTHKPDLHILTRTGIHQCKQGYTNKQTNKQTKHNHVRCPIQQCKQGHTNKQTNKTLSREVSDTTV